MIPNIYRRLIWADRTVLVLGALYLCAVALFWVLAFGVVGAPGAQHLWNSFGTLQLVLGALALTSVWIVMRIAGYMVTHAPLSELMKKLAWLRSCLAVQPLPSPPRAVH